MHAKWFTAFFVCTPKNRHGDTMKRHPKGEKDCKGMRRGKVFSRIWYALYVKCF